MVEEILLDNAEEWDRIVKSFHQYDIYYLSCYVKAFKVHGDGEPRLIYFKDEQIKAINVVMKRDIETCLSFTNKIPQNTYFDLATPYGYGGFIIEGEEDETSMARLNREYSDFCVQEGIVTEFVRFHPVLQNKRNMEEVYEITDLGKTITIELGSKDQIWSDFTSNNRNMIRKAIKSNIQVFWGLDKELVFNHFIPLYHSTMDRDYAKPYYYFNENFYNSILYDLKYNSIIFYAKLGEKIIAMSIILLGNGFMHYHLSASDEKFRSLAPTNLLLYEAACWGSENGFKTLHLGGGVGSKEDNLYKFKQNFNRYSNSTFSIGKKIFDKKKYIHLNLLREKSMDIIENSETSFFPAYRESKILT